MKDFLRYFSNGTILALSTLLLIAMFITYNDPIFYAGIFIGTIMLRSLVDIIIN